MSSQSGTAGMRLVLLSNDDSLLEALASAGASGLLNAEIVAVVSDKAESDGVKSALSAGIPAVHQARSKFLDRQEYDAELARRVDVFEPDLIILSGWTHALTAPFIDHFQGRILVLHPALPGAFQGTHAVERAFYAFCRGEIDRTGVSILVVNEEEPDSGQVLAQEQVPILAEDTLESLEMRIDAAGERLLINLLQNRSASRAIRSASSGPDSPATGPSTQ